MRYDTRKADWAETIYPVVTQLARRISARGESAQDLAQDLIAGLLTYDNLPDSINDAWLKQRLRWLSSSRGSAQRKRDRVFLPEPEEGFDRIAPSDADTGGDTFYASQDAELYRLQLAGHVAEAIQRLPAIHRPIVQMMMLDKTDAEICASLGLSRSKLSERRQEATACLSELLAEHQDDNTRKDSDGEFSSQRQKVFALSLELDLEYLGPATTSGGRWFLRCNAKGHEWEDTIAALEARYGCPKCLESRELSPSHFYVLGREKLLRPVGTIPRGSRNPARWTCVTEDHPLYMSYADVRKLKGGCPACTNHVPKTINDYRELGTKLEIQFVDKTIPANTHIPGQWICEEEGHLFSASYSNLKQATGCPFCAGKYGKSPEQHHELARAKGGFWLGPHVRNARRNTNWECSKGHTRLATFAQIKSGQNFCLKCAGLGPKKAEDYRALAKNRNCAWVGRLPKTTKRLSTWQCAAHGRFKASYEQLSLNSGCQKCAIAKRRTAPEEYHRVAHERGWQWRGPEVPNGNTDTGWWCGKHEWQAPLFRITTSGKGCPHCAGVARKTADDYHNLAASRGLTWENEGAVPSNNNTPTRWYCVAKHHLRFVSYKAVYGRAGCPTCNNEARKGPKARECDGEPDKPLTTADKNIT